MMKMQNKLWKLCRTVGMLALAVSLNASMCSEDEEEKLPEFKSVWRYESFMFEAYTADGKNPYIREDGEDTSKYPLGVVITRDKMHGEERVMYAFGADGFIYSCFSDGDWRQFEPYRWDGGKYIEGVFGTFFPIGQTAPPGFGATEITNEVLKHTDTELQVKQTQVDGNTGTRIINLNNFVKVK